MPSSSSSAGHIGPRLRVDEPEAEPPEELETEGEEVWREDYRRR